MGKPHLVWIFFSDATELIDLVAPKDVFRCANELSGREFYDIKCISAQEKSVRLECGLELIAGESLAEFDDDNGANTEFPSTIVIAGGAIDVEKNAAALYFADWLRRNHAHVPRIASVCTGAFTLAHSGLLDHKAATTHWSEVSTLRARYPAVEVLENRIFVSEGKLTTSAGMSTGMDLMLSLVEDDLGHETSLSVAEYMVLHFRRPGEHGQRMSAELRTSEINDEGKRIRSFVSGNLKHDLSVARIAYEVHASERAVYRICRRDFDCTPAEVVRRLRIEEAKRLLEMSSASLDLIAREVGAKDTSVLRRWFVDVTGASAVDYRKSVEETRAA